MLEDRSGKTAAAAPAPAPAPAAVAEVAEVAAGAGAGVAAAAVGGTRVRAQGARRGLRQGLTLVHFPAQPEPFLTQNTP